VWVPPMSIEKLLLISIAMIDGRKALRTPGRYGRYLQRHALARLKSLQGEDR
jgi:hypothetical protein